MKRIYVSLAAVADRHSLRAAFLQAARGKRDRGDCRAFAADLDQQIDGLRRGILDGSLALGRATRFVVFDPKQRVIHAPCFAERVLHHALMLHLGPVIERGLIAHTYACRVGRGQFKALDHAQACARRHRYFLKLDIRRYFDSIPHAPLLGQVERRVAGQGVLALVQRILAAYQSGEQPGVGLPIGALTSQHLANLYLNAVDRQATEGLRIGGYCRYMDDIVLWDDSPARLRAALVDLSAVIAQLGLSWKPQPFLNRSALGLDFLGWRVYPGRRRLNRRSRRRLEQRVAALEAAYHSGSISAVALSRRATAAFSWAAQGDTRALRRRIAGQTSEV
ncbi:MAG: RNA-directed DNA polymerase [Planctomycetota bacterium]|nr:MAG: RNA-directed DNA polymerase [Planctomycetota bacterium]